MMPFYGDVNYFKQAVESVLAQSDPDWRLVIIDDKYPDQAARTWAQSLGDDRVRYLRNDTNLGVSGNFAKCVQLADAEFTTIMGCDDLLLQNYVSSVKRLVRAYPDAAYVHPGVRVIDEEGEATVSLADRVKAWYRPRAHAASVLGGEELARSLLRGNWSYFPAIAWRTSVIQEIGFRAEFEVVLDLALQIDIIASGGTMALDGDRAYAYRRHQGSVSSWKAEDGTRFHEEASYFAEAAARMRSLGWHAAARAAVWHVSSRLNELSQVPRALAGGGFQAGLSLAAHALKPGDSRSKQR
jgi:glycosyltransferase involved in cell wall biosynthesis